MLKSSGSAMYGDASPIAAFATTPGKSALTLIRCSGKSAIELLASVFSPPEKLLQAAGNTVVHGWIVFSGEKTDEVLVSIFRAPKSYTGEDSADISCHGGAAAGKAVMDVLKSAGFRDALPGEFTFRAFVNGKLDFTRSESVMELVSAKTETGRRHAVSRLCGSLETEINEIKKMLIQALSGAEIYLDYSEDEISADAEEAAGMLPNREAALAALARLKKLSASWQIERIYQEGITVVIAGCPNSGKSSLFNALLKEDRSIVTEIPGTTRDWIEAWVSIKGIPVRLIDTAGLRETADSVEEIGVQRSRRLLEEAELVLYLIDGEKGLTGEDVEYAKKSDSNLQRSFQHSQSVFIWNKADISSAPQPFPIDGVTPVSVSAKTGDGLDELYSAIAGAVQINDEPAAASLGTERQKKLVDAACFALDEALALSNNGEPLDLIAPLLREAVNSLGEITGEVSTADILEEMFSRFCVGK